MEDELVGVGGDILMQAELTKTNNQSQLIYSNTPKVYFVVYMFQCLVWHGVVCIKGK